MFHLFNETDGIYADANDYKTRKEAKKGIENFLRRFDHQGYYFTNRMERIPVSEVVISIRKEKSWNDQDAAEEKAGAQAGI